LINNFKCKETQKIWERTFSKKFPDSIQKIARRKLIAISISESITDLKEPPSNHLKKLEGNRKSQYSIWINNQWRICFKWKNGHAFNVEIADYH
jgi:toxin HigB-1